MVSKRDHFVHLMGVLGQIRDGCWEEVVWRQLVAQHDCFSGLQGSQLVDLSQKKNQKKT